MISPLLPGSSWSKLSDSGPLRNTPSLQLRVFLEPISSSVASPLSPCVGVHRKNNTQVLDLKQERVLSWNFVYSTMCTSVASDPDVWMMLTDPDEDFLFLLRLLVERAVFLVGGFLYSTGAHVPSPPTKQLDGLGKCGAFVPAILLA